MIAGSFPFRGVQQAFDQRENSRAGICPVPSAIAAKRRLWRNAPQGTNAGAHPTSSSRATKRAEWRRAATKGDAFRDILDPRQT